MEENTQKFIDLHPLSKWKRLLVFLGDYFISFIISFVLFNLVVFPAARIIVDTPSLNAKATGLEQKALRILKDDGFLFFPNDGSSFLDDVNYTFKVFLSYYAFDEETPDANNPQYGHKLENEVVRHYYEKVKDANQYVIDFKEVNEMDQMFNIGSGVDEIVLKADYKILLANELLEVKDEEKYSEAMVNFRDHVFARLFYIHVYNDITANDYVKDGVSFNACINEARQITKSLQWVPTTSAIIAILLSWGIVFVLYPLINKDNRTITMSIMSVSKLHYKTLGPFNKKLVMIRSFYHFVALLSYSVFLPALLFGIAYCFNLPLLFVFSAASLLLIVISGLFMIFNQYNRSGTDILTNTVMIPNSEIDNMYIENLNHGNE